MKVAIPGEVLFRDLGGESVLLHLGSGQYFGLDEVGTLIWKLLADGCSLEEAREGVLEVYDASPAEVEKDMLRIVEELRENGLLDVSQSERDTQSPEP